jgi:hypothetical protein
MKVSPALTFSAITSGLAKHGLRGKSCKTFGDTDPPIDQANLLAQHMTHAIVDMNHTLTGWFDYFTPSDCSARRTDSSDADCANEVIGKAMPRLCLEDADFTWKKLLPQRASPLEG